MTDRKQGNERMVELARKWQDGSITEAEKQEFDQWYNAFDDASDMGLTDKLKERIYRSILAKEKMRRPAKVLGLKRISAAAAVLVLLFSVTWLYRHDSRPSAVAVAGGQAVSAPTVDTAIVPGGNKAILTLAGGGQVILDSAKNGLLASQGGTEVVKEGDGTLSYQRGAATEAVVLYNTITTPRGGQYAVTLPDGSKVWLNAASSIRFPTAFTGVSRNVEVRGEAYFEIAADKTKPFRVAIEYASGDKKMDVEVLGTQFNVMAYEEEGVIKTTLIEGAVKVEKDKDEKVLHPGQQAQLSPGGVLHTLSNADTEAAVAWKNGRTVFNGQDIQTIMRQVSRWYDVDVVYAGHIRERKFTGGIARNSDISVLLKILELNQIHFSVEGKKIVLMP